MSHSYNVIITLLASSLVGTGCAHHEEQGEALETASPPEERRFRPPEDPRYAISPAQQRAITIFLDSQTYEYREDGRVFASGSISSGSPEHPTPAGDFRILSKEEDKRSGKYTNYFDQNTPMPYSLQFHGPYFIHEGWLPGHADSHGCVRLRYEDAKLLFSRARIGDPVLIKRAGRARPANPFGDGFPFPLF
jgi:lipoprotein-anchoring transpeptidase ErfK/SrfK